MMEAAPAPEPQGVNIPAIVAGAAIGKAIAVKGNDIVCGQFLFWEYINGIFVTVFYNAS
jgi:hypothetical protein